MSPIYSSVVTGFKKWPTELTVSPLTTRLTMSLWWWEQTTCGQDLTIIPSPSTTMSLSHALLTHGPQLIFIAAIFRRGRISVIEVSFVLKYLLVIYWNHLDLSPRKNLLIVISSTVGPYIPLYNEAITSTADQFGAYVVPVPSEWRDHIHLARDGLHLGYPGIQLYRKATMASVMNTKVNENYSSLKLVYM